MFFAKTAGPNCNGLLNIMVSSDAIANEAEQLQ